MIADYLADLCVTYIVHPYEVCRTQAQLQQKAFVHMLTMIVCAAW